MQKFIVYFNNQRKKINDLYLNDKSNSNHHCQHLGAIGSLRMKITEMMKNIIPTEEYSYFHNEVYNRLTWTINDTSLTSQQISAINSMKNLTSRTKMLIDDMVDGIFKETKEYYDLYFEDRFINYYFDLAYHTDRVDKLMKITDKIQKYLYYPFNLDKEDKLKIMYLINNSKNEMTIRPDNIKSKVKKEIIEKIEIVIEKKNVSLEYKQKIVKELDNLKVQGLKDKCIELNISIVGAKLKNDYITRLYKHYGITLSN